MRTERLFSFVLFKPSDDLINHPFTFREIRAKHREGMNQLRVAAHMAKEMLYALVSQFSGKIKGISFQHIGFAGYQVTGWDVVYNFRIFRVREPGHRPALFIPAII